MPNRIVPPLRGPRVELRPIRIINDIDAFGDAWELVPPVPLSKTGKRGEELFHLILSGIREIYDISAVIAGGAVRDTVVGVTNHKDVDVFIPLSYEKFFEHQDELGWQGGFAKVKTKNYNNPDVDVFRSTARVSSIVQGCLVDLVFVNKPLGKEGVVTFPIHAQRCVWTLEDGLSVSPEAREDIEGKKFTIDPTTTDKARIRRLVEKALTWKAREGYTDWKIVKPEVKEWWEGE